MGLTLNDAVAIPPDVLFRALENESVLLNLKTGIYFGLNQAGTRAWQLFVEHGIPARAADIMAAEYDVERGVLEQDLLTLIEQLAGAGLCDVVPAP